MMRCFHKCCKWARGPAASWFVIIVHTAMEAGKNVGVVDRFGCFPIEFSHIFYTFLGLFNSNECISRGWFEPVKPLNMPVNPQLPAVSSSRLFAYKRSSSEIMVNILRSSFCLLESMVNIHFVRKAGTRVMVCK